MSNHCPYCNADFISEMAKCPHCGASLGKNDKKVIPDSKGEEKSSLQSLVSPLNIIFIVVIIVGLLFLSIKTSEMENELEERKENIEAKNAAYEKFKATMKEVGVLKNEVIELTKPGSMDQAKVRISLIIRKYDDAIAILKGPEFKDIDGIDKTMRVLEKQRECYFLMTVVHDNPNQSNQDAWTACLAAADALGDA